MDLTNEEQDVTLEVSKIMELSTKVVRALTRLNERGTMSTLTSASIDEIMALSAYFGAALIEKNPEILDEYMLMINVCRQMYNDVTDSAKDQGIAFDPSSILVPTAPDTVLDNIN